MLSYIILTLRAEYIGHFLLLVYNHQLIVYVFDFNICSFVTLGISVSYEECLMRYGALSAYAL